MNKSRFRREFLASGQAAPYTGDWVDASWARTSLFNVQYSGASNAGLKLQFKNPFDQNQGIDFYEVTGLSGGGLLSPMVSASPFSAVRAVSEGQGFFQVAFDGQS